MPLKILLFGKDGQVGRHLVPVLSSLGDLNALGRAEVDFATPGQLADVVRRSAVQVIVNAAAYTDVDQAEVNPELAYRINAEAVEELAQAAKAEGAALVHYSTDYVFDGELGRPYSEEDTPNPLSAYGRSKLAGEEAIRNAGGAHLILRTSWVYALGFDNFVTRVMAWLRESEQLRVVSDQIGSPTWAVSLAEKTGAVLEQAGEAPLEHIEEHGGLYHLAGAGAVSRYEWACAIMAHDLNQAEHVAHKIEAVDSNSFAIPAPRPKNSALDCSRIQTTFGLKLDNWEAYLQQALKGETQHVQ